MSSPRVTFTGRLTAVALATVLVGTGCAEEGDAPDTAELAADELEGWSEVAVQEHEDVLAYDQVAASPALDGMAWFTRAGDDGTGLALWSASADGTVTEAEVETPDRVTIPVAMAADGSGRLAVAVTRDRPNGANTGLVAWRAAPAGDGDGGGGDGDGRGMPEVESVPIGEEGVPASVSAGRAGDAEVVTGVIDGEITTWVGSDAGWVSTTPDLGIEQSLRNARVTGAGDRLVLAAVDDAGTAHMWVSNDGAAWAPVDVPAPAEDVISVGALGPAGTEGQVAVCWLAGEGPGGAGGGDVTLASTRVAVQRLEGDTLTDGGTIEAEPDDGVAFVNPNGVTARDGWLVVVGSTVDDDGTYRPGLWAGAGGRWAPSAQDDLVDRDGYEFRAVGATTQGELYGVLVERGHVDVELWQAGDASG